jgi:hypothetical protein
MKKKSAIISGVIFSIILLALLVIAVPMENTNVIAPTNGVNASGGILTLFNVTFQNGSDASGTADVVNVTFDTLNVTFWLNLSETDWHPIGNATTCASNGVSNSLVNNISCWGSINASTFYGDAANLSGNGSLVPNGFYRINATVWNGSNGAYGVPKLSTQRGNLTNITIDNTQPSTVTPISLNSGNNHSTVGNTGNLTLNVTVVDGSTGINVVTFNILNLSGTVNGSYVAIRENDTIFSFSINTSHFPDGGYNISIFVNDTAGNHNVTSNASATAPLKKLLFDNTKPTASPSCSNVDVGDAFPCSCAGSDVTSGVNSTSGGSSSPDGTGTTASTGTFTYTCTVTDRSGNLLASSITYTVSSSGGSSGGGSSGGGSSSGSSGTTSTPTPSGGTIPSSGGTTTLSATQTVTFMGTAITVSSVSETSATLTIGSTTVTLNIGQSREIDESKVTVVSISNGAVQLQIDPVTAQATTPEPEPTPEPTTSSKLWIWIIVLIVIVIAVVFYILKRKNN